MNEKITSKALESLYERTRTLQILYGTAYSKLMEERDRILREEHGLVPLQTEITVRLNGSETTHVYLLIDVKTSTKPPLSIRTLNAVELLNDGQFGDCRIEIPWRLVLSGEAQLSQGHVKIEVLSEDDLPVVPHVSRSPLQI